MQSDVNIRRDYRFTLEEQWHKCVTPNLEENVVPLTVFGPDGRILGWILHGWSPPAHFLLYNS